ncbi:hypothetical protein [Luteimicrobium sp. DT211]|uniref:hypothetical protein n=1 Tax=Luteimicrobium sp. DT211 TaxID=3393412 RepID=UPI003CE8D116
MTRSLLALGTAGLLLLLGGCSSSHTTLTATLTTASPLEAKLEMDVALNDDGTVSVSARSNLPDGTELGASVFQEGGFVAQDPQTLQAGAAAFGPFSDKGQPLRSGTYDVSVTMPIARNQPAAVRAIIGAHGENLTGSAVSKDSISGDAVVTVEEKLVIP